MNGVEEWRGFSLAITEEQKLEKLKDFVRKHVQNKRVRGFILASLGELWDGRQRLP